MDKKFLSEMDQALTGWSDPATRLREALERDEFVLYCQPIRALGPTGGFPIAEVLVRLREEEAALLPPGEFLPVLEHYGLMSQLDRWVVRHVVARLKAGSRVPGFSLNISARSIEDVEFVSFVSAELKAARLPPASLLFEMDEPDVIRLAAACARFARDAKHAGCGIMIDGFGRQSVSFAALESLDPDFVKVDGSIVRKILSHPSVENKLKAVIRVGEAAGFGVVAECVEDQDVLVRLKALGVGYVQGFGVLRPHPIDSVATEDKDGTQRSPG